uniref:DNA primase n=1 Tax=Davidia involucrata TaxID=16924 RepID=A0A5B7BAF8_DAVIN
MAKEETENGRDDMQIDGCETEQMQDNAVPDGFNANYLKVYYGKLFPHADIFKWMSYGNDGKHPACDHSYFGRREFSFTLDNDIYLRFQSFNSAVELENSIKEKCPFKIDIGPVYSVDPAKRHAYAQAGDNVFTPVEKELVFDVDITDYDDVRYCCSGADICLDCWPLMTVAIKVIDTALRDDFGFNHVLWVYSGRRGVHCWVCDRKARRLNNEQRAAIADYFRVYKGNENSLKKVSLMGLSLHPFLARSYTDVLKDFFEEKLLPSQKLFSNEERFEKILEMIPDESITSELRGKWQENRRSISKEDINVFRWEQLKHVLQSGKQKVPMLRRCVEEIVFSYTYPRLDMEVSKHMNHLLKAPFCVHPKTGRVCIPIDPNHCEEFDPTTVPTLSKLLGELNMGGLKADGNNECDRTSLGKSIRYFRSSFLQPLLKSCKEEMEISYNEKMQQSKNSLNW